MDKIQRELKIERFLGQKENIIKILIIEDILLATATNYIVNFFFAIPKVVNDFGNPLKYLGLGNIFPNLRNIKQAPGFFFILFIVFVLVVGGLNFVQAFKIRSSYSVEGFNLQHKGVQRWTTNEEIKEQYKEIPDRDIPFSGYGGTIISRIGENLYIDTSVVNNYFIGITRSGKDEMYVIPTIDILSRAEEKTSIVAIDPKLEEYKSSKAILEQRGYDVYLLNLDDPDHSMGFNPLEQTITLYEQGDYANAELLAQSFSYSIFHGDKPVDSNSGSFWEDNASSLFTAMIIANIEDAFKQDDIVNKKRRKIYATKRRVYDKLTDREKEAARELFSKLEKDGVEDVISDSRIKAVSDETEFVEIHPNRKKINAYSLLNTFIELALLHLTDEEGNEISAIDTFFNERPPMDRAKLKYAAIELSGGYKTKGGIFSTMLSKLTIFTYETIGRMTAESTLNLEDIGFGDKPVAVFLGIPDYDRSTNFLATAFIRQMYFVLAKKATRSKEGKCKNRVKVIMNEAGNIPAVEAMESIITVCLGRNISFDLYFQSDSQLADVYGDKTAKTIKSNCGNHVYIMTNDEDTAHDFSKAVGNETVIEMQRSGERLSMKKSIMESTIDKPLIDANRLMQLYEGESVVRRVMTRKDMDGNPIHPTPIFNSMESGKNLIYRYKYLTETFPLPGTIDLQEINTEDCTHIDLKERVWDYWLTFKQFGMNQKNPEQPQAGNRKKTIGELFNKESIKANARDVAGIIVTDDTPVMDFAEQISKADIKDIEKEALLSLITMGQNA